MLFLRDLSKRHVVDAAGRHVGHVQDAAFRPGEPFPVVSMLAVHVFETGHIGRLPLLRPVEDIVITYPTSVFAAWDGERLHLKGTLDEEAVGWTDELFLRRDVIDSQIMDARGHKVQRVDDIFLQVVEEPFGLRLGGIEAGFGGRIERLELEGARDAYESLFGRPADEDMIPWGAVAECGPRKEAVRLSVAIAGG